MPSADVFCRAIDNFGDIAISWRIARGLANEHAFSVRLWIDDLASFARLRPEIDPTRPTQGLENVTVCHWPENFPNTPVPDLVVETLGSDLPETYLNAMATCQSKPVWVYYEYLSAEDWTRTAHLKPAPHPRLPLTRYFFYPGFTAETGGLLREKNLIGRRQSFETDPSARQAFWDSLHLPPPEPDELRLSMFAYANATLAPLLEAWAKGPQKITALIPPGRSIPDTEKFLSRHHLQPGLIHRQDHLTIALPPFLPQDHYDLELWACDLNFVRGEDSFVRAQWAGKPFVWHIYPQDDQAHMKKLGYFLHRYTEGLADEVKLAVHDFWFAWNGDGDIATTWQHFSQHLPTLRQHAKTWADRLASRQDAVENLVDFYRQQKPD